MLVSQRITAPQMTVTLVVLPLHIATTWALIHPLGLGYLGAAVGYWVSQLYSLALTAGYVALAGLGPRVWGTWGTETRLLEVGWPAGEAGVLRTTRARRMPVQAAAARCAAAIGSKRARERGGGGGPKRQGGGRKRLGLLGVVAGRPPWGHRWA